MTSLSLASQLGLGISARGSDADSLIASTKLILNGQSPAGGTTFTDRSPVARAITNVGTTTNETTSPPSRGISPLLNGAGKYLTLATSTDFDFLTTDQCYEALIKPNVGGTWPASTIYTVMCGSNAIGQRLGILIDVNASSQAAIIVVNEIGGGTYLSAYNVLSPTAVSHIGLHWHGDAINSYLTINGVVVAQQLGLSLSWPATSLMFLGASTSDGSTRFAARDFVGGIQWRITKRASGQGRYRSFPFTPPASFPEA